jgi:hypothetical protein
MRLKQEQSQGQCQLLDYREKVKRFWDKVFKENQFPTAPSNLVREGLVTEEKYTEEASIFGLMVSGCLVELYQIIRTKALLSPGSFVMVGGGNGRFDLNVVNLALNRGSRPYVFDVSPESVRLCTQSLKAVWPSWLADNDPEGNIHPRFEYLIPEMVVKEGELQALLFDFEQGLSERIEIMYLARVLQFFQEVDAVLKAIGALLTGELDRTLDVAVFVHPFPEDNKDVVWTTSQPCTREVLLSKIKEGMGLRSYKVLLERKFSFFRIQTYTFLAIACAH